MANSVNYKKAVLALNGVLQGEIDDYQQIIDETTDLLIAADGGALLLEKLGLKPHIIIGDMDSLDRNKLNYFREKGSRLLKYPVKKDETDAELALRYCSRQGLKIVSIIGSLGGRFDQQLANIYLLEYALKKGLNAIIQEPGLEMGLIDKEKVIKGKKDSWLSLIPLTERVERVYIKGCSYELSGEQLFRYRTRGISNKIVSNSALINIEGGLLLYIIKDS